jgi:hypothetical protein
LQGKLLSSLGKIAGVAGLALGVFLLLVQDILQEGILQRAPNLDAAQTFAVILSILILTFGIAGVGVIAWLISRGLGPRTPVSSAAVTILAALFALVLGAAMYAARQPNSDLSAQINANPLVPIADGALLRQDPAPRSLTAGTKVFVDDQSCPSGQIRRITSGEVERGILRAVACVPKKCTTDKSIFHTSEC